MSGKLVMGFQPGEIAAAAGFIAVPLGAGFLGAQSTADAVRGPWYQKLKKPSWNPPNWLFAPVWTFLYVTMGVASWLVFREGGLAKQQVPLGIYAVNVALNLAWSPLFFKHHQLGAALGVLGGIWGTCIGCVATFWRVRPLAGQLLLPYLAWVSFAGVLNAWIWCKNPNNGEGKERGVVGKEKKAPEVKSSNSRDTGKAKQKGGACRCTVM